MRRRTLLGTTTIAAAAALGPRPARAQDAAVDVLLVLAVDVSRSIDEDEARLQREGYRNAITHPMVMEAIQGGTLGAIGLAYVEWAGIDYQRLVLPWTRIASQADAEGWAAALGRALRASLGWTSVSGGIDFSRRVLAEAPWHAARRIFGISGDGVNNSGPPAEAARPGRGRGRRRQRLGDPQRPPDLRPPAARPARRVLPGERGRRPRCLRGRGRGV